MVVDIVIGLIVGAGAVWLWARGEIGRYRVLLESAHRSDDQWDEHLKAMTSDLLSSSTETLVQQAEEKLRPIKETLSKFEEQAQALEIKRAAEIGAIPQLVESLRRETGSLVTALRAPHIRGGWGEMQLKRVVELAGMVQHCDFDEQASTRDGEGKLLRPDMVVRLPGGKNIVVDSKTPLEAFLDAAASDDEAMRRTHLARHSRLVREHMTKLSQKQYWKQFEPAPEFVVMFVDEGLFRAALDQDPGLFEAGVDEGVVIASPATLIALLRTVAYCWQQETVAASAREVSRLGRELYDRLGVFAGHFGKIGRALNGAVESYNKAIGSFETRVLVTARKFPEHGAGDGNLPEIESLERQARPMLDVADDVVELPTRAA